MAKVEMPHEVVVTEEQQEYLLIKDAFTRLIFNCDNSDDSWEIMEDIISLRTSFLIDKALAGLRIDFDRALEIIRHHNEFITDRERSERDVLVAAIDNLIDFVVAEEVAMMRELPDELELDKFSEYEAVCEKYNLTYASAENSQVLFAATMAYWWLGISNDTITTFMTQQDERVRAWHLSLEGLSYRKSEFPAELIPPIEWGCRCFLVTSGFSSVYGALKINHKEHINPIFSESLAKGGRIFGSAHPYFVEGIPMEAKKIADRLKSKFYMR